MPSDLDRYSEDACRATVCHLPKTWLLETGVWDRVPTLNVQARLLGQKVARGPVKICLEAEERLGASFSWRKKRSNFITFHPHVLTA